MKIDIPDGLILDMHEYILLEQNIGNLCHTADHHEWRLKLMQMKKEQIADMVLTIIKIQIQS